MQAQADFLDIYRPITNAATETLKVALRGVQQLNELQLAQSQFAVSQATQGIEGWWRLFRAIQDSQLEALSRMEAQVAQATQAARSAYDLAVHAIQDASLRGTAWSGVERRKASVIPFTGPERRRAA